MIAEIRITYDNGDHEYLNPEAIGIIQDISRELRQSANYIISSAIFLLKYNRSIHAQK